MLFVIAIPKISEILLLADGSKKERGINGSCKLMEK